MSNHWGKVLLFSALALEISIDHFAFAIDVEFFVNVLDMKSHSINAEAISIGDEFITEAILDTNNNVKFPGRKIIET